MTNEEIMKFLKEHEERKPSGKPFTDEEYAEADAEDKAKMDDYAEFCAYLAEREAMDEEKLDEDGSTKFVVLEEQGNGRILVQALGRGLPLAPTYVNDVSDVFSGL